MKCDVCDVEIKKDHPIVKEVFFTFDVSDSKGPVESMYVTYFCSKTCNSIDDIMEHAIYYGDNIQAIVNHLIKDHGSNVEILETALNSNDFKHLWTLKL